MILVTGGTGFIGSHLVERLVAEGHTVRCLVRARSSLRWLPLSSVELAEGDLITGEGLAAALREVRTVFHLAGVIKAARSADYHAGNVQATANLAYAARGVNRFVHVSSLAAVGPSPKGDLLDEEAEPAPLTTYGRSKLESERVLRRSHLFPRTVIVRPPVVYGPRDTGVLQIFRLAVRGLALRIGRQERFFSTIFVDDLVSGLLAAERNAPEGGRTYFLANARPVSWSEFEETVASLAGRRPHRITVPAALAYAAGFAGEMRSRLGNRVSILSREKVREACRRYWTCSPDRATRELGFRAETPLANGVAATLEWYRGAGWLRF